MEIKQNPFSFYDFLGYFVPGSIFIYFALGVSAHALPEINIYSTISGNTKLNGAELYAPLILAAYIIGHLISFISAVTIERYSTWMYGYPSKALLNLPRPNYFSASSRPIRRSIIRMLVFLVILPVSIIDLVLLKIFKLGELLNKPLDPLLIKIINKRMIDLLSKHAGIKSPGDGVTANNSDFFRYMYHYALENAPNHVSKMQNYVALYGLLRSITLCSVIVFWVAVWHLIYSSACITIAAITLAPIMLVTYMFYMAFIKFYRRFSLEAMMAASVAYAASPN